MAGEPPALRPDFVRQSALMRNDDAPPPRVPQPSVNGTHPDHRPDD
jgi:hypothetical protein